MKIGLRIDVDTFRGTRYGVPNLCNLLGGHGVRGSFFFSVGPDNMGRHLFRLLRPEFFRKMMRTQAASLYGWDILLRGTFWPGPVIGEKLGHIIRSAADQGHEAGFHAWDHQAWQACLDKTPLDDRAAAAVTRSLMRGVESLTRILGHPPVCSAVPGWKCDERLLEAKSGFAFTYNSDCRGERIFLPIVDGKILSQPQIPVTLPTYDEVIGRNGITGENYNEYLFSLLRPGELNVLTIHAEVEGIACLAMFSRFLRMAQSKGIDLVPLGNLLDERRGGGSPIQPSTIVPREIRGREGWVSCGGFGSGGQMATSAK